MVPEVGGDEHALDPAQRPPEIVVIRLESVARMEGDAIVDIDQPTGQHIDAKRDHPHRVAKAAERVLRTFIKRCNHVWIERNMHLWALRAASQ